MTLPLEYILQSGVSVVMYRPSTTSITVLPTGTPISGTNGTDGVDGTLVRAITNESELVPGFGNNGDWAILVIGAASATLYGPKAGGAWPLPGISLIGASGATSFAPSIILGCM